MKRLAALSLCTLMAASQPNVALADHPCLDDWTWSTRNNGFVEPAFGFDVFANGRRNGNFCAEYRRIVLTRSDLASIRGASRTVRNRIQVNDLNYLCRCEGFRSPLCFVNGR